MLEQLHQKKTVQAYMEKLIQELTRRNMLSLEKQFGAHFSYVVTLTLTLTLTLVLLNPKSIGFHGLSRTTAVPSFKSFRSVVFVLSC